MSFTEIQHQATQLSALEQYELWLSISANLRSLSEEEIELIQAAQAARRLEDIRSGKTQMIIGNDWRKEADSKK